jgi:hypothetical protein
MNNDWQGLLKEGIFYSPESMTFYKVFYAGMGNDDVRELPTQLNSCLHNSINVSLLARTKSRVAGCVGRYRDDNESDEADFDFKGYFTPLVPVEVGELHDYQSPLTFPISKRIVKALLMASDAHSQQKRKCDGSPYVQHLLEVQSLLVNIGDIRDEDIIIAGLLHDVLEDSETTKRDLLLEFGSRVASIVAALTDDKSLSLTERRDLTINKLEFAPKSIKLIKLADICSNAGALPLDWNKSRVGEYFSWLDQIALICKDANESLYNEYLVRRH